MAYNNVYRPILGIIKRRTDKALLLVVEDSDAITEDDAEIENWIPKSQMANELPTKNSKGQSVLMLSEWIIGQKGLNRFVMTQPMLDAIKAQAATSHPAVPKTPPAPNFQDMDDDIPS